MDRLADLGIDLWSIVVYMANTGVVLTVLFFLAYKPLLKFIDERRKRIADSIEEANLLREEFSKTLKEGEAEKNRIEKELRDELKNLEKFLEEKRVELTKEMEEARQAMLKKSDEELAERKARLVKDVEKDVMNLMTRIILDIVQNKVPESVIQESIQDAWKQYHPN